MIKIQAIFIVCVLFYTLNHVKSAPHESVKPFARAYCGDDFVRMYKTICELRYIRRFKAARSMKGIILSFSLASFPDL